MMQLERVKEVVKIHQLAILLAGILLVLNIFYMDRFISSRFESSIITLDSLLPSKNAENLIYND